MDNQRKRRNYPLAVAPNLLLPGLFFWCAPKRGMNNIKSRGANCSQSKNRSATKVRKAQQNKIYSKCAPSFVVDLIEDLDKQRLELMNQMCFHGLVSLKLTKPTIWCVASKQI